MAQATLSQTTVTESQWVSIQNVQRAARAFLLDATSGKAKANLLSFQKMFNAAFDGLAAHNAATGGDKDGAKKVIGGTAIAVDGLWGPQSALAMALVIWSSFPAGDWMKAATQLATQKVLNKVRGAQPISRAVIASTWTPTWKNQVNDMVWPEFASNAPSTSNQTPTTGAQTPPIPQQNPSVPKQNPSVPGTATGQMESSSSPPIEGEAIEVVGSSPRSKSLTWLWVTLGLAGVGGGLWWAFGRKAR